MPEHPEKIPDPEPAPPLRWDEQLRLERDTGELYRGALVRASSRGDLGAAKIALLAWEASIDKQVLILREVEFKKGAGGAQPSGS